MLLRVCCLLALGTSIALLIDYTNQDPSFCGLDSGCGAVRQSGFGYLPVPGTPGIPVPVFGVIGFSAMFAASFLRDPEMRRKAVALLAYPGAFVAVGLVFLQGYLGDFCSLCLVVDSAAIVISVSTFALSRGGWEDVSAQEQSRTTLVDPSDLLSEGQRVKDVWQEDSQSYEAPNPLVTPALVDPFRLKTAAWIALSFLAVLAPWGFSQFVSTTEVPSSIRSLYASSGVTVVEFFDFQCPHCRDLSPRLKKIVDADDEAMLRFGYTPLPHHPFARDAARLAICAGEQGKEVEVASIIFGADHLKLDHLTPLAEEVSDSEKLAECLASTRPDVRIEEDTNRIKTAGFEGLPTTYIGETRILGSAEDAVFQRALEQAHAGSGQGRTGPLTYWGAVLAVCIAIALLGRVPAPERTSIA